ncbi:MAG: membrane or secreted protein [Bacteroidota bacterium]
MKYFFRSLAVVVILLTLLSNSSVNKSNLAAGELNGSWMNRDGGQEQVVVFIDGYTTHTIFSKAGKKFIETRGGTYTSTAGKLNISYEFDTKDKEQTGHTKSYDYAIKDGELTISTGSGKTNFVRLDEGAAPLSGLWAISGRMQDGKIEQIHRTGTRKTIKILSGSRFQWAAIDPGTKLFAGTGGGSYEFKNGKYTEHIEFFSRDSSRVGASLSFDGKLENGDWHHSGLSSKGDKIYEIWSRKKE